MGIDPRRCALVVDDDPSVARQVAVVLGDLGYEVFCAYDAVDALKFLGSRGEGRDFRPDLLIADVFMPGILGPALVERIRERYPAVKVVYVTGAEGQQRADVGGDLVLGKPFTVDELIAAVTAIGAPETRR